MSGAARDPLVSVVVPVYNHSRFVGECLESIRGSGYSNLEIVVLDDASRDDSLAAIDAWHGRNLDVPTTIVRHAQNMGVSRTLNEGVRIAAGDFICPLASDDALLPGGIALRVDFLRRHPDKLAVFADSEVIDGNGTVLHRSGIEDLYRITAQRKKVLGYDELIAPLIFFHWGIPGPGILLRRETFREIGEYDETLRVEDWDFYNRLALAGKLGFVDAVVAQYRVHGRNAISQHRIATMEDAVRVAERYFRRFALPGWLRLAVLRTQLRVARLPPAARFLMRVPSGLLFFGSLLVFRLSVRLRMMRAHQSARRNAGSR